MSVYERILSKLFKESLKNVPGLDAGTTKLAPGTLLIKNSGKGKEESQGFRYTIVSVDRSDPENVLYKIRSYGRNGVSYSGDYERVIDSKEIKKYKLG